MLPGLFITITRGQRKLESGILVQHHCWFGPWYGPFCVCTTCQKTVLKFTVFLVSGNCQLLSIQESISTTKTFLKLIYLLFWNLDCFISEDKFTTYTENGLSHKKVWVNFIPKCIYRIGSLCVTFGLARRQNFRSKWNLQKGHQKPAL